MGNRGIVERGPGRILGAPDHVQEGRPGRGIRFVQRRSLPRSKVEKEVGGNPDQSDPEESQAKPRGSPPGGQAETSQDRARPEREEHGVPQAHSDQEDPDRGQQPDLGPFATPDGGVGRGMAAQLDRHEPDGGRPGQETEQVVADREAEEVGRKQEVAASLRGGTMSAPAEHQPADRAHRERGRRVHLGLVAVEPVREGEAGDQSARQGGSDPVLGTLRAGGRRRIR
jgi:hypothetical protein